MGLRWRRRPWESRPLGGGPGGASTAPPPQGHRARPARPSLPGARGAAAGLPFPSAAPGRGPVALGQRMRS